MRWTREQDLISHNEKDQWNLFPHVRYWRVMQLTGLREQNTFQKKSMTQLTDHKDGECVIYWCVTIGGLKGINSTLWCFQSHQPELTAMPKHKEDLQRESICQFLRNISKNDFDKGFNSAETEQNTIFFIIMLPEKEHEILTYLHFKLKPVFCLSWHFSPLSSLTVCTCKIFPIIFEAASELFFP